MSADVLVIGAGPFGLSISAHLRGIGVEHRIVGRPMDTWRARMPIGMKLKSEPYASAISSPRPGYDVATYCKARGLAYTHRQTPLSLEQFLAYADWYTGELVPDVMDNTVTEVTSAPDGFRVAFADADPITVRQIVVATGVLPHAHVPDELSGLPSDLLSHTCDVHEPAKFRGRRVAVVGAGQSALETAALLNEAGTEVQLIVRRPAISWIEPNPAELSLLGHIRRPTTKLCEGWHCAFWNTPAAFQRLPQDMRITKARTVLGPNGSAWLKDRIEGVVEVTAGHRVKGAVVAGSGVQVVLDGPKRSSLDVDHVVAGTGFRVGVNRLTFLPEAVSSKVATVNGFPVVNRSCQSAVPGLYFVGAPAAVSLGPSMRFIAGTHNVARQVARAIARGQSHR